MVAWALTLPPHPEYLPRPMRGVISIIIGIIFIIGGLTGKLALIGTNSGTALAVVGAILIAIGAYRMAISRR